MSRNSLMGGKGAPYYPTKTIGSNTHKSGTPVNPGSKKIRNPGRGKPVTVTKGSKPN